MFKLFGKKKDDFFVEIGDSAAAPAETASAPVEVAPEAPAEAPAPAPAEAPAEAPAKETKTKKTSIKNKAAKVEAPPAPAAAPVAPAPKKPEVAVLFAPNYLMPTPTSTRRRPGANMNGFLDMAKQYKKR